VHSAHFTPKGEKEKEKEKKNDDLKTVAFALQIMFITIINLS